MRSLTQNFRNFAVRKRDMKDVIEHIGIVEKIENTHIQVRILQASACSECHAKSLCSSADAKEKIIDVWDEDADSLQVGDRVKVCAATSMGRTAVRLAFVWPLILMVAWMVASLVVMKMDELVAIVGVAVLLTVYYAILALGRKHLRREFSFWIEQA